MTLEEFAASRREAKAIEAKAFEEANKKIVTQSRLKKPKDRASAATGEDDMNQNDWEHLVAEKLLKKPKSVVRKIFAEADDNASGMLDSFEFYAALQSLGVAVSQDVSDKIFSHIDEDGGGTIGLDELLKHCLKPKGPKLSSQQKKKFAALQWMNPAELFARWDKDGNGQITGLELIDGLRFLGLSSELATQIIKDIDTNEDKDIDKEEWVENFYKSSLVSAPHPENEDFADLHHNRKGCVISKPEERGITLHQLNELVLHIKRRCGAEEWKNVLDVQLNAQTVTLYDAARYVISPATYTRGCSYVELIASSHQRPKWIVSHWWGEPVLDFVATLDQHRSDRDLSLVESPYWICAYAKNQWDLKGEVSAIPSKSSFHRALSCVQGCVVLLDKKGATLFNRVWCIYEVFTVFSIPGHGIMFDVYAKVDEGTHQFHGRPVKAVGITNGATFADGRGKVGAERKELREKDFPLDLAELALSQKIEKSQASVDSDLTRILNIVAKAKKLDLPIQGNNPKFEELNSIVTTGYAIKFLPAALSLRRDKIFFEALKVGRSRLLLLDLDSIAAFTSPAAKRLGESLPAGLQQIRLNLNNQGDAFLEAAAYDKLHDLNNLSLRFNAISETGMQSLVKAFTDLHLENLNDLDLNGNVIKDDAMIMLFNATNNKEKLIDINVESNPCQEFMIESVMSKRLNYAMREHLTSLDDQAADAARYKSKQLSGKRT